MKKMKWILLPLLSGLLLLFAQGCYTTLGLVRGVNDAAGTYYTQDQSSEVDTVYGEKQTTLSNTPHTVIQNYFYNNTAWYDPWFNPWWDTWYVDWYDPFYDPFFSPFAAVGIGFLWPYRAWYFPPPAVVLYSPYWWGPSYWWDYYGDYWAVYSPYYWDGFYWDGYGVVVDRSPYKRRTWHKRHPVAVRRAISSRQAATASTGHRIVGKTATRTAVHAISATSRQRQIVKRSRNVHQIHRRLPVVIHQREPRKIVQNKRPVKTAKQPSVIHKIFQRIQRIRTELDNHRASGIKKEKNTGHETRQVRPQKIHRRSQSSTPHRRQIRTRKTEQENHYRSSTTSTHRSTSYRTWHNTGSSPPAFRSSHVPRRSAPVIQRSYPSRSHYSNSSRRIHRRR